MKINLDKYHPLVNSDKKKTKQKKKQKKNKQRKQTNCLMKVCNETITNGKYEKLLGIKIDHNLNFNEHVILGKKRAKKLHTLSRIAFPWTFNQGRLIMNSFHILFFILFNSLDVP